MVRLAIGLIAASIAGFTLASPAINQVTLNNGVHTMEGWDYKNCGLPEDAMNIESITVSPDPPQPGQDLTVNVVGSATRRIEEGAYADVTVKLGLIKLLSKRFDVCEEARSANVSIQCPVEEGKYTVSQTVALPKEIPRAKFVVQVRGYTADDDDMACLDLTVDFMKGFPRLW